MHLIGMLGMDKRLFRYLQLYSRIGFAYHSCPLQGDELSFVLTRHWRITDSRGTVNLVDGEGVVGETPVLAPGATHDYVSGCELTTRQGSMEGHYTFAREARCRFESSTLNCTVPGGSSSPGTTVTTRASSRSSCCDSGTRARNPDERQLRARGTV